MIFKKFKLFELGSIKTHLKLILLINKSNSYIFLKFVKREQSTISYTSRILSSQIKLATLNNLEHFKNVTSCLKYKILFFYNYLNSWSEFHFISRSKTFYLNQLRKKACLIIMFASFHQIK